ncbi:MAG: methyltransferase [Saprospiraceae bacterium]|nr:methyltransferase [Saprospiraceae bacterium]
MRRIDFLREGLKNLKTVGTVTRSSKFACREMIRHVDFKKAKVLVELGAGDGVITRHILDAMSKDAKLLLFEVNPEFCEVLRGIKDDRLIVVEDSAEKLPKYLEKNQLGTPDYIISAIPFVAMPDDISYRIVETCRDNLKLGGKYVQIHYSLLLKKMYKRVFGNVNVNFVPLNIPPAFILVSEKSA